MADDAAGSADFTFCLGSVGRLAPDLPRCGDRLHRPVRDGGWPAVGSIVAVMGLIDAVFAPKILKSQWEREDAL